MKESKKGYKMADELMVLGYLALSYWALNYTFYADKIEIYSSWSNHFIKKLTIAMFFGWVFIPWALLKMATGGSK